MDTAISVFFNVCAIVWLGIQIVKSPTRLYIVDIVSLAINVIMIFVNLYTLHFVRKCHEEFKGNGNGHSGRFLKNNEVMANGTVVVGESKAEDAYEPVADNVDYCEVMTGNDTSGRAPENTYEETVKKPIGFKLPGIAKDEKEDFYEPIADTKVDENDYSVPPEGIYSDVETVERPSVKPKSFLYNKVSRI